MSITENEIYYCTHCGATNKKSAVDCVECGKKIISKYRPFYDFLKNHSKEEGIDIGEDTLLTIIRRFLMSHIYGIVLSVTIIAAGAAALYETDSHISDVNAAPFSSVQIEQQVEQTTTPKELPVFEFTENDWWDVHIANYWYRYYAVNFRAKSDEFAKSSPYGSEDDILAEKNIPGYKHKGEHELITNPIDMLEGIPDYPNRSFFDDAYMEEVITGNDVVTDTAKTLRTDGYEVAEVRYIVNYAIDEYNMETHQGKLLSQAVCYMVMVCYEDNWYVAEDKLIEKKIFV